MKLLMSLGLMWVLFCTAYPLQCDECVTSITGQCTTTKLCPANQTRCASATVLTFLGVTNQSITVKTCATPGLCLTGSVNLGRFGRSTVNTLCCDTDLCNKQNPPALIDAIPNLRECFTCIENNCTHTLPCLGEEDRCITALVSSGNQNLTLKGCAAQTVCSGNLSVQLNSFLSANVTCCEGNMCNSALGIGQSVLLLLLSLVSITIFY